jgi:hypothetical protein
MTPANHKAPLRLENVRTSPSLLHRWWNGRLVRSPPYSAWMGAARTITTNVRVRCAVLGLLVLVGGYRAALAVTS